MSSTWPATPLTVLTPVVPGEERELRNALARLPHAEESPFSRVAGTHFARWVVLSGAPWRYRGLPRRTRPLRMQYLLFTSTANCPAEQHVEDLRTGLGRDADAVWGHCVGYPGHDRPADFCRYLLHNRLPVHRWFAAYDATVDEVGDALDLRRRHARFAMRTQRCDPLDLQAAFRAEFEEDGT
ncbi:hypothetical protein ACI782_05360 [Geodermatophilus sp. SYSU D00703]